MLLLSGPARVFIEDSIYETCHTVRDDVDSTDLAPLCVNPAARPVLLARRRVYPNCSWGASCMYPWDDVNDIHPPRRRCTSSAIPNCLILLDPPTRNECPEYSAAQARVIRGTQSNSELRNAVTTD